MWAEEGEEGDEARHPDCEMAETHFVDFVVVAEGALPDAELRISARLLSVAGRAEVREKREHAARSSDARGR